MPNVNMNISLPAGGPGQRLSVGDGNGQNQIAANAQPTTITWTLTGALQAADFVPMSAAEPGFSWLPPAPPAGFFGTPTIGDGGNSLSIPDNHLDNSTDGTWAYMLRVVYNGKVFTTTNITGGIGGTVNRPVIINR